MLNVKKPVETRDGRKARILWHGNLMTDDGEVFTIVAAVEDNLTFGEAIQTYTKEGYSLKFGEETGWDLVNVAEKKKAFVNVYNGWIAGPYMTAAEAKEGSDKCAKAVAVPIEWEE